MSMTIESDESLRERLLYVAGDGEGACVRIMRMSGHQLDDLAYTLGLHRRP